MLGRDENGQIIPCKECNATRLEEALPTALASCRQALDGISQLHLRLRSEADRSSARQEAFERLINRTTALGDSSRQLKLPSIRDLSSYESAENPAPIWEPILKGCHKIFEGFSANSKFGQQKPEFLWAVFSIGQVDQPKGESALGFAGDVLLHSGSGPIDRNGASILKNATRDDFYSLGMALNEEAQQSSYRRQDDVLAIWVRPLSTGESKVAPSLGGDKILTIPTQENFVPDDVTSSSTSLLVGAYRRWRRFYETKGSLSKYWAPFSNFSSDGASVCHLVFVPILFAADEKKILAGTNLSIAFRGEMELDSKYIKDIVLCLISLQSGLAATTVAFAQAERRMRQLGAYQSVMRLVEPPLRSLTQALAEMQQDTQSLRSILMEPGEGLFESRHLVSECFEQGNQIRLGRSLVLEVAHQPELDRQPRLQLAAVLTRIFGLDYRSVFDGCENEDAAISCIQSVLIKHLVPGYEGFMGTLGLLCDGKEQVGHAWIVHVFTPEKAVDALKRIKATLFAPFKVHTSRWSAIALYIALRGGDSSRVHPTIEVRPSLQFELDFSHTLSPTTYQSVLEFLIRIQRYFVSLFKHSAILINIDYASENARRAITVEFAVQDNEASPPCSILIPHDEEKDTRYHLIGLLAKMTNSPRDWRLLAGNAGDIMSPYLEFASRLLDLSPTGKGGGSPGWVAENCKVDDREGCLIRLNRQDSEFKLKVPRGAYRIELEWCARGDGSSKQSKTGVQPNTSESNSTLGKSNMGRYDIYLWDHEGEAGTRWEDVLKTAALSVNCEFKNCRNPGFDLKSISRQRSAVLFIHAHGGSVKEVLIQTRFGENEKITAVLISRHGDPAPVPPEFEGNSRLFRRPDVVPAKMLSREGINQVFESLKGPDELPGD